MSQFDSYPWFIFNEIIQGKKTFFLILVYLNFEVRDFLGFNSFYN